MKKDPKGRNLRPNEDVMADGRYRYRYTQNGERKAVYSWKLVATDKVPQGKKDCISLRQKEKQIEKDLDDGIDVLQENITLNEMFDRYISLKTNLKQGTRSQYVFLYNAHIRNAIGLRKIKSIKYSDLKSFYNGLLKDKMNLNSLHNINALLYPTFALAVRDNIIRNNVATGIMKEMESTKPKKKRHALTVDEQRLFFEWLKADEKYNQWYNFLMFTLGTGCRIGEVLGLQWENIDFEKKIITIDHNFTYRTNEHGKAVWLTDTPKTESGTRKIPLFSVVEKALLDEKTKPHKAFSLNGYSDFVFLNCNDVIYQPTAVNNAIKQIYARANKAELENARNEDREPVTIRHFSAHNLRHTFCTRLCEVESNLRLIMDIMGHSDIKITMNIYNEIQDEKKQEAFEQLDGKIFL